MIDYTNMNISAPEITANSLSSALMIKKILLDGKGTLFEMDLVGAMSIDSIKFLDDKMSKLEDSVCIYSYVDNIYIHKIYKFSQGMVQVSGSNGSFGIQGSSFDEQILLDLKSIFHSFVKPKIERGYVFAIVNEHNNFHLSTIGNAGIRLNKINYTDKVNADYNYIVQDLNSKSPSGRITIFEGDPGTGKSHIIRSLLLDVPGAMFVLVPPDMVSSLSGPQLLPLLLRQKQSSSLNGPIILLLEDADKCLVSRQADNINSIQSLLNLGDGILGSLLDLRIVATTNAKELEIEPAILRPGRLSKRVEVNLLDHQFAIKIYKHLLPESNADLSLRFPSFAKYSLATIYSFARQDGWIPIDRNNQSND